MLPPPKSGKRALATFDEQLSRLRQTLVLPTTQQLNAASRGSGSCKSSGNDVRDSASDPNRDVQPGGLYGGTWRAAAASFQDPSMNWSDSWQYLRRARRERQEEFSALEEAFVYDEAEEVQRLEDAILSSEQPVFHYRHSTSALGPQGVVCLRTTSTAFLHGDDARLPEVLVPPRVATKATADTEVSSVSVTTQRSSSSASTDALRDLYDGEAALRATGAAHSQASRGGGGSRNAQLGYLSSVASGGAPVLADNGGNAECGSASVARSERSSVFSSEIVRRQGQSSAASSISGSAVPAKSALSHVGTVVAHSSVDVRAHIHRGKQAFAGRAEYRGEEQRTVVTTSTVSIEPSRAFLSTGAPCVARVVHRGSIRFCRACGACTCTTASESGSHCAKCGEPFNSRVAPVNFGEPRSGDQDADNDALRQIAAFEAQEALSFQQALMEWRSAVGADGTPGPQEMNNPVRGQSTLGMQAGSTGVPESVGSRCDGKAPSSTTWARSLPQGYTYFSHLWDQMQRNDGEPTKPSAER